MNKKILGLVLAGVLAVTSLPAVTTSAAERTSTIQKVTSSYSARVNSHGAQAYSDTDTSSSKVAFFAKGIEIKVYDVGNGWYAVRCVGEWGYVKASDVSIHP